MPSSREDIRQAVKTLVEQFYTHRVETVQRFASGVVDDVQLDQYENELFAVIEPDASMGGLVWHILPSGFDYDESDEEGVSCLSVSFNIKYNY